MFEDAGKDLVESVLCIVAHPDDIDFGAGGTIKRWTEAGVKVTYCLATNGDAGGFDLDFPRELMPQVRQEEQRAAGKVLGVSDIRFLGYQDGQLEVSLDLRKSIAAVIREVRPQRVLTQNPERNFARIFSSHPDHMAAGEAALDAVYPDARNPFAFPDLLEAGLLPHSVEEVWIMSHGQPDTFVDVSDTLSAKLEALRCHVSQETDKNNQLEERIKTWLEANRLLAGWEEGRFAEAFLRVTTN
ncbi:MAG: PIG-L family deacetylase [Firmicutes bacterium]|jgi:LmbE family N-acetylglucosaminyl deacetylase|nr:PIG-L family deacetylase [Bacillota bacterium]